MIRTITIVCGITKLNVYAKTVCTMPLFAAWVEASILFKEIGYTSKKGLIIVIPQEIVRNFVCFETYRLAVEYFYRSGDIDASRKHNQ